MTISGRERATAATVGLPILCFLSACQSDSAQGFHFNAQGESFAVEVLGEGSPSGEPQAMDLHSNLGTTLIGSAELDPGSGPVGTRHRLVVEVLDDFQERVARATIVVKSQAVSDLDGDGAVDARDNGGFELSRDSADGGWFAITLQSVGAEGEERTDLFTVHLWTDEKPF